MSKCKACQEEFEQDHPENDLCKECEKECTDGGQVVILGKNDAALVVRGGDELVSEMYITKKEMEGPETLASDATYLVCLLSYLLHDQKIINLLITDFDQTLKDFKEEIRREDSEEDPEEKEDND